MPEVPGTSGVLIALEQQCIEDSHRWFPECDPLGLPFFVLALAGEVGELANEVKKVMRGSADFKDAAVKYKIDMEVADIFTYLLQIAGMLQIDLEAAYHVKRVYNEQRFGARADRERNGGTDPGAKRPVRLHLPGEAREGR